MPKVAVNYRIEPELKAAIEQAAEQAGVSQTVYVEQALERAVRGAPEPVLVEKAEVVPGERRPGQSARDYAEDQTGVSKQADVKEDDQTEAEIAEITKSGEFGRAYAKCLIRQRRAKAAR